MEDGVSAPSPRSSRGEGWGEGLFQRARLAESPPPPPDFAALRRATSPRKRGEVRKSDPALRQASRRLDHPGVEMLQPRHHFVLEERQRIVPGFGVVLVVEH